MTSAPPPSAPPPAVPPPPASNASPAAAPDDWSNRWADEVPEPAGPAPTQGHRPRITHLVLVDGLPADHWVEDGGDLWQSRLRRRGGPALTTGQDHRARELRWLEALVGGRASLLALDDRPLVTAALDLDGLRELTPGLRARARAISGECDRLALEVFGSDELVMAVRHLLAASLAADPGMLDRSTRDDTAMGALVWVAGQANGLIGPEGHLLARDLWPRLGVPPSAAGRGAALLERLAPGTAQLVAPPGAPRLRATGLPSVLLGATRALLVSRRDEILGGDVPARA